MKDVEASCQSANKFKMYQGWVACFCTSDGLLTSVKSRRVSLNTILPLERSQKAAGRKRNRAKLSQSDYNSRIIKQILTSVQRHRSFYSFLLTTNLKEMQISITRSKIKNKQLENTDNKAFHCLVGVVPRVINSTGEGTP